jgi:hypothetical protein
MFNEIKKINKKLAKTASNNSSNFLFSFLDYEDEILSLLKNFSGTKSEIYLREINNDLTNLLKFSSLFSNITLLNTAPSPTSSSYFSYSDGRSKYFRERNINIPPQYVNETGIDAKRFLPIYFNRNDQELKKLFSDYKPLVRSERLIIRLLRGVCVNFPEVEKVNLYYVDPNTPNNEWYINEVKHSDLINIDNGAINYTNVLNLFDITLPYFTNTGLDTICKILDDEEEIVSTFRSQLKKLVIEAGNDYKKIQEIKQDVLRPSIETLNRKFKAIQTKHRIIVGSSLGTFVLSLAIGTIDSDIILKAMAALTFMGVSNSDFNIKIEELRDNPHYLLWKIKVNR